MSLVGRRSLGHQNAWNNLKDEAIKILFLSNFKTDDPRVNTIATNFQVTPGKPKELQMIHALKVLENRDKQLEIKSRTCYQNACVSDSQPRIRKIISFTTLQYRQLTALPRCIGQYLDQVIVSSFPLQVLSKHENTIKPTTIVTRSDCGVVCQTAKMADVAGE